ncbi:hypothetical protein A1D22_06360 [Pasteurellaceae bacterium LFhippo2]|nr:hypothetical protein [Pasteurellaceae bacterium LFhippo2]
MKKSVIALLVSSIFILSACDDKQMTQKVTEAEKQIVQLNSELQKAQSELSTKTAELDKLKEQAVTLSEDLANAKQKTSAFPALQVEILKLFDKSESIKHPKDPKNPDDEYYREETNISLFASIPKTQIEWLNDLLLNEVYRSSISEEEYKAHKGKVTVEQLKESLDKEYNGFINDAKEEKPIGLSRSVDSYYLGQRNNIVFFSQSHNSYYGGAHGMYYTRYLNFDVNKKELITLNSLVPPKNQAKLRELLWESYINDRQLQEGEAPYAEKSDFRISEEFFFSPYGITFVYPPYELGPFAEGEIEVPLYFHQLNELLNSDYRLTEKDGFGLNQNEY